MVYFDMLVVIGLGGRCLATDDTFERPFARVAAFVFGEIVSAMEYLSACVTAELLGRFVFARVAQPIVFAGKLTAAMITRVRLHRLVRIHVRRVLRFANERLRAQSTFERLRGSAGMDPAVLLQIPFGGQFLVANGALVGGLRF